MVNITHSLSICENLKLSMWNMSQWLMCPWADSNGQPSAPEADVLSIELQGHWQQPGVDALLSYHKMGTTIRIGRMMPARICFGV